MVFMEIKTNNHVWGQYKNRIVICSGCQDKVKRCEARFVLWGGVPSHFCVDALLLFTTPRKRGAQ